MDNKISIVMPVYNAAAYLQVALDSLLAQSDSSWELCAVDDGSTDGSSEILDAAAAKDSRIRVTHIPNSGISTARNTGIDMATGSYVGFIDSDDTFHPDMVKDCLSALKETSADWLKFGKFEIREENGQIISKKAITSSPRTYTHKEITDNLLNLHVDGYMSVVWNSLIRREVLENSGVRFDTSFTSTHEDIDFNERLAPHCAKLVVVAGCYYNHYTRPGISISSRFSPDKITGYLQSMEHSNARYVTYGIHTCQTDTAYLLTMTKQIVANVCNKLNVAGDTMSFKEKKQVLQHYHNHPAFSRYLSISPSVLWKKSKKLFLYDLLFYYRCFGWLLIIDQAAAALIRWVRKTRSRNR